MNKNNYRKLDNMAKIFSLNSKNNNNIYRYSVILKDRIDKDILKLATHQVLEEYRSFKVKLSYGFLWSSFKLNKKPIIIEKEKGISCNYNNFINNNNYLFKITYINNKINFEFFHVLTDGVGAIKFVKTIIYNYLNIKYSINSNKRSVIYNINYEDEYIKKYDKSIKYDSKFIKAYKLKGKINNKINNTYHYTISLKQFKNVCNKYNVSITQYLIAIYIYAIYLSIYNKKCKKEIIITVPIDLRNYYKVETLSNFFVTTDINSRILKYNLSTFEQILNQVKNEFKEKISEERIKQYLTKDVKLGTNIYITLIPNFIKKFCINFFAPLVSRSSTSTLSNVGNVNIDNKYKKYIDNILILVKPGRIHKIKCTICSFGDNLNITLNSNIDDLKFQKSFLKLLKKEFNDIKIQSNIKTK